ncbi:MAG: hypothetical protein RLZZ381_966 [Cyanobacteriota bacterium]|jgi:hypothetical protein
MANIKIYDLKIIDRNLYLNNTSFPVEISGIKLDLRGGINPRYDAIIAE